MSTISQIVGLMDGLSNSELEQVMAVAKIRLGIRIPSFGEEPGTSGRQSSGGRNDRKSGRGGPVTGSGRKGQNRSGRGNPTRKSQWETHPLYREYSRLKKVVETQAKEEKISFNSVNSAESVQYRSALTAWLEAKSTFRSPLGNPGGGPETKTAENPPNPEATGSDPASPDDPEGARLSSAETAGS